MPDPASGEMDNQPSSKLRAFSYHLSLMIFASHHLHETMTRRSEFEG